MNEADMRELREEWKEKRKRRKEPKNEVTRKFKKLGKNIRKSSTLNYDLIHRIGL